MSIMVAGIADALAAIMLLTADLSSRAVAEPLQKPQAIYRDTSRVAQQRKPAAYPTFKKSTPYESARKALLSSGWQPVPPTGESPCQPGDDSCEKMPELQSCAGTGEGNCLFLWRRDGTVIAVSSISDPPLVDAVECRSKCR